ncbi:hypothetical protein GCM10010981_37760 [Dyella nitratireducens]|uniref:Uncharacterized protein n=1 Tax=Dyella nitratireducens TaxID=1849580 RepID=A0ABQ1GK14_9GAMM|nr:hypothetical protein GCM10010981_37760 [Dyella nitratireducens]GLQ41278.1 hypothetical protein GCM10007902_11280 [Dyella nitratireducens]
MDTCACTGVVTNANAAADSTQAPSASALQRVAAFRINAWCFMDGPLLAWFVGDKLAHAMRRRTEQE